MQSKSLRIRLSVAVGLLLMASTIPLSAELPPGAYDELKSQAEEVLSIRVTNVSEAADSEDGILYYTCDAEVTSVTRSKSGIKAKDTIRFETYYISPNAPPIAGPAPPPRIEKDWQGKIYLNPPFDDPDAEPNDEREVFRLAAYGQSFEEERGRRPGRRFRFRRR